MTNIPEGILNQSEEAPTMGAPDATGVEAPKTSAAGPIDTKPFVAEIEKNVPPDQMKIFKMMVLKGDAQMFSKDTHEMTLAQLEKPGPMGPKLAEGAVALMYILFQKSNKTLPPQLLEPAGTVLLCHAFDYLQERGDPEATKETFGDAVDKFSVGIHKALGVTEDQFNQAIAERGKPQAEPPTEQPGILGAQP